MKRADARSLMQTARAGLQERLETLASDVDRKAADMGFRGLLVGMTKLLHYGMFNQYLILTQRPEAIAVAGCRQWKRLERKVRDGETPIWIIAPKRKRSAGYPFITVEVFDIAQTDGPPPPDPGIFDVSRGECPHLPAIERAARLLRIELEYVHSFSTMFGDDTSILGKAFRSRKVQVRKRLPPLETASVIIHEYAHVLLLQPYRRRVEKRLSKRRFTHDFPPPIVCEAEAEATSFVVLQSLGLPSRAPSYIVWQGGRGSTILASMRRIQVVAGAILAAIGGERPEFRVPRLPKAADPTIRVTEPGRGRGTA